MDVIFADNYNYIVCDQRMMKMMVMLIIRILGNGGPCPREYISGREAGRVPIIINKQYNAVGRYVHS